MDDGLADNNRHWANWCLVGLFARTAKRQCHDTITQNNDQPDRNHTLREKPGEGEVLFILGGNTIQMPRARLSEKPQPIPLQEIIGDPSFNSVSVYLKDNKPFVDVKMWGYGALLGRDGTYSR